MIIEKPLRIGAVVSELLMASPKVLGMVADRIYPYRTNEYVKAAHIVYDGINVEFLQTKDGEVPDTITLTLNCNTTDYNKGIDLAEAVIDVFEDHQDIAVTYASCEYNNGAMMFTHSITINIEVE